MYLPLETASAVKTVDFLLTIEHEFDMKNKYYEHSCKFRHWLRILLPLLVVIILILESPAAAQISDEYRPVYDEAVAAGIDRERLETLFARAQNRQISPEDVNGMVAPAISLVEQDLPWHPVLLKAMEGMAKRVPPHTIRQVLDQMESGFARAAALVDPWLARDEVRAMIEKGRGSRDAGVAARSYRDMVLENTSYALQHNIREESIRDFLEQVVSERATERSGMTPVATAVRVLPDLPTSEDDQSMSNRILVRALNAGFSATEIQQLPDAFRSAQFQSRLPIENIAQGIQHQLGEGIPAQHILENLFQGNVGGGPPGFIPPGLDRNGDRDDHPGRGRRPETPPGRDR